MSDQRIGDPPTVYIVSDCIPYEGLEINAVFATREAAEAYVKGWPPQNYEISEHAVRTSDSGGIVR